MEAKIFKVVASGRSGTNETWINSLDESRKCEPINVIIPPEFDGPGGTYSPEDLYILSLVNCFLATYKFIAEKSKIEFLEIKGEGELSVEKGEEKAPWMKSAKLHFTIVAPKQKERAMNLLEKTKHNCMIINSVKTDVQFSFTIID